MEIEAFEVGALKGDRGYRFLGSRKPRRQIVLTWPQIGVLMLVGGAVVFGSFLFVLLAENAIDACVAVSV